MKKKLLYLLLLFGILFCIKINVNAKEILSSDISPRTYVIGTHEFTESTTLSTRHIMLASKTIDGDTLDNMVIYYKNPRGKWINGLTGEIVEVSEKFNIEFVDLVKFLTTPTLANDYNDKTKASLSILGVGYYGSSEETLKEISGWELYEKTTNGYTKITEGTTYTYEVALTPGETKTFVARVYKLNEALDRVYSDYSNELEVTRETLNTPTLANDYNDKTKANLSILGAGYYGSSEETLKEISGWELYEKTTNGYSKITEGSNYIYQMELVPGETKTFVARVYKDKENGDRIYSEYSNELEVTREELQTPTLANDPSDLSGAHLSMAVEGYYASGDEALKEITGWELYEKTENGYVVVTDDAVYSHNVSMEQGTTKTFISRVYFSKADGTKIYSEYSNEVVVTIEKIKAPTLSYIDNTDTVSTLTIISEGTYKDEAEQNKITGWELYEFNEELNTLITSGKTYPYMITIPNGITKEYIARIYIIDVYENKVYSEYSNKIIIKKDINKFATDSWDTIISNVKEGNIADYKIGNTKKIDLGDYGTHTVRIANLSTPSECSTEGFSQTACGFVLEFADIITTHDMNPAGTYGDIICNAGWNRDGWPGSNMYSFVQNDIYNSLPSELKNAIIDTIVVSGHGKDDTDNFTSTDKLYLLSPREVWDDILKNVDTANDYTRQLDYYKNLGVYIGFTKSNTESVIKKYGVNVTSWWLRTAYQFGITSFYTVKKDGEWEYENAYTQIGVSPAFRIG